VRGIREEFSKALEELKAEFGELWSEEIEGELVELVKRYKVPISEASSVLRRKHLKEKKLRISELSLGFHEEPIRVRVLNVKRGGNKKRVSGIFGDESGLIPFISHIEYQLEEGKCFELRNFLVRRWKGIPTIELVKDSSLQLSSPVEIRNPLLKISELLKRNVNFRVRLIGCILSLKMPSGIVRRCSLCGRILRNGRCKEHENSKSYLDMRLKFILDDGSSSILAIASRKISEEILGMSLEECISEGWEKRREKAEIELKKRLLGKFISIEASLIRASEEILKIERVEVPSDIPSILIERFFEVYTHADNS
jgi:ssDNA-binding replication factor A large subunit